ncbi:MAG: TIGR04076 family protein [Clostridia bacterium]|nr:TIGR04076 family protein [Clostridia bacterium]
MKKCRITAMKQHWHNDLMELYENPIKNHCDMEVGSVFISVDAQMPEGFCSSAWESVYPFVLELAKGGGNFFDGWMKNPYSAMVSCNDGFRPMSFYVEAIED